MLIDLCLSKMCPYNAALDNDIVVDNCITSYREKSREHKPSQSVVASANRRTMYAGIGRSHMLPTSQARRQSAEKKRS